MEQFLAVLKYLITMLKDNATAIIAVATLWAVYYGPRHAAEKTRESDERREKERRKWEIFRTLMRYREEPESEEFVDSLNLIEVEFCDHEQVIAARREFLQHLNTAVSVSGPELTSHIKEGQRKKVLLLQAIAKICNAKIDNLDIVHDAYISHERENEKKLTNETREWVHQTLAGSRHIPVQVVNISNESDSTTSSTLQDQSAGGAQPISTVPPSSSPVINWMRSRKDDDE